MPPCIIVYSRRALARGLLAAFLRTRSNAVVELSGVEAPLAADAADAGLLIVDAVVCEDFAVIARLRRHLPDLKALAVTGGRGDYILHRATAAGAQGVVHATDSVDVLLSASAMVVAGGIFYSPGVIPKRGEMSLLKALTDRELRVLELVCAGSTDDDAAQILGCASVTIETHRRNLMRKVGVCDRSELIVLGLRMGIAAPDEIVVGVRRRRSSSRRIRP